jgi:hypothetical protein
MSAYGDLLSVIEQCRVAAGLRSSPDGPTGDVRNLLGKLTLARRNADRETSEQAFENEQVRRLRRDGRCPVCGAEERHDRLVR